MIRLFSATPRKGKGGDNLSNPKELVKTIVLKKESVKMQMEKEEQEFIQRKSDYKQKLLELEKQVLI